MTLLLTGGAGFIGSNILKYLNDQGEEDIIVVDNLGSSEKWKNLVGKKFLDVLHKQDLFAWLAKEPRSISAILHLGACSSTTELDANYLLENNTHYSMQLALYALENNIRFIYASSAATYGDGSKGFSDDHALLEHYEPLNMYGYSKHLFDLWAQRHGYLKHFVGLKYFNVFGPNEFHKGKMASAILRMVADIQKEGVIHLFKSDTPEFGDGEQVRDFIYVKDAAAMTVQFLHNQHAGIYNIGTGQPSSWNALARATLKGVDLPGKIEYTDMPKELKGKYQNYTCATMQKSQQESLYLPKFSLEEAVIDYVRGYVVPQHRL